MNIVTDLALISIGDKIQELWPVTVVINGKDKEY